MAVFTPVSESELSEWLQRFDLGTLQSLTPIASGIENTNYFANTGRGQFVLTLVERIGTQELPFFLRLMRHLAHRGVRCPEPMADRDGALHGTLNGKPATLVTRLPGRAVTDPDETHCAAVGALLARMHQAAQDFGMAPANPRGAGWWPSAAQQLLPCLTAAQSALLQDELNIQLAWARGVASALPRSAVHADLFRDNVLFGDDGTPGAIDFFFACDETWVFDLAVCCNDWCLADVEGRLDPARLAAMQRGYASVRPLTPAEEAAWPMALRAAALRFWMSRLHDWHFGRSANLLSPKDPAPLESLLRLRRPVGG